MNCSEPLNTISDLNEMPELPVVAEMFLLSLNTQEKTAHDGQERNLIRRARRCIGEHYGYGHESDVPNVAIEMYIDQLMKELHGKAHQVITTNASEIVETLIDWALVCGVMNRPQKVVLH